MVRSVKSATKKVEKTPEVKVDETPEVKEEESKEETEIDEAIKKVEKSMNVIWNVRKPIFQKSWFIKTREQRWVIPLYQLPEDLRKYLTDMGFGTNVYEMWEEWLIKHNADMEKIEELKKFISENYL